MSQAEYPVLADLRLAGERIALRPVVPGDIDAAFSALHGRPEILDWLVWNGPERREDLEAFYGAWARATGGPATGGEVDAPGDAPGDVPGVAPHAETGARDYALAIVDLADGEFCGCIGLRSLAHPGTTDLGYWVAAERWGRGFASEAIRLATWLAFGTLRSHLIYANVFIGNEASRRALEKSGFSVDRESTLVVDGTPRAQWCLNATRRSFLRKVGDWRPSAAKISLSGEGC